MSTYPYQERTYGRTHADVITKFCLIDGFSIEVCTRGGFFIQRVGSFFWLVLFPPLPVRGKDKVTTQCEIEILTFFGP